jgi:Xaa-Pro dipeptidase
MRESLRGYVKVEPSECRQRQRDFARRLSESGYDGAVVFSRGGGTLDRYADVFYLTGHYQPYVYLPDLAPRWSGRSHCAYVMSSDAKGVLCVSVPNDWGSTSPVAESITCGEDFAASVAETIDSLGLGRGRLCLVGNDVVPASMWGRLSARLRSRLELNDELLAALRRIKSSTEQGLMRSAASMGREAVTEFLKWLRPGVTEAEAVAVAAQKIFAHGGTVYVIAVSSGPETWSYQPKPLPGYGQRRLEEGDLVRLDLVAVLDGYMTDFGRTAVVGEPDAGQQRLLEALHAALDEVIATVAPGRAVRDIVAAGDALLEELGIALGPSQEAEMAAGYPPHWGHGLGLGWERPWLIDAEDLFIEAGMCLAIERSLAQQGVGTASAEQNLIVTSEGAEVLTEGPAGRWS